MAFNQYSGMEIAAIRSLARTMDGRADEIEHLMAQATAEVNGLTWRGEDRERFVREWESHHARQLLRVSAGLREAANHARRKASEQERISRAQ